jgi:GMP synthase-like glutamine amidotransferase
METTTRPLRTGSRMSEYLTNPLSFQLQDYLDKLAATGLATVFLAVCFGMAAVFYKGVGVAVRAVGHRSKKWPS